MGRVVAHFDAPAAMNAKKAISLELGIDTRRCIINRKKGEEVLELIKKRCHRESDLPDMGQAKDLNK
jgi:hypothetical protein